MSHELHYTSAPRGLKPGSRGFCTVACTAGLPAPLADRLESLSGYRQVFPPNDPSAGRNPVAWSHLRLSVGGKSLSILSRVGFAGLDYTDRTNKYAHHVAISSDERPAGGPAWLLSQPGFMDSSWTGEPRILPSGRRPPSGDSVASPCHAWASTTGDAGWAGVVAASLDADPDRPIYLIFEPGMDLLPLVAEALSLLPPARRWDVTFSTYFTGLPSGVACTLRCVLSGSRETAEARRFSNALVLDLTAPLGSAPDVEFVRRARNGQIPTSPVGLPANSSAEDSTPEAMPVTLAAPPPLSMNSDRTGEIGEYTLVAPSSGPSPSRRPRGLRSGREQRRIRKLSVAVTVFALLVCATAGIVMLVHRSKINQPSQKGPFSKDQMSAAVGETLSAPSTHLPDSQRGSRSVAESKHSPDRSLGSSHGDLRKPNSEMSEHGASSNSREQIANGAKATKPLGVSLPDDPGSAPHSTSFAGADPRKEANSNLPKPDNSVVPSERLDLSDSQNQNFSSENDINLQKSILIPRVASSFGQTREEFVSLELPPGSTTTSLDLLGLADRSRIEGRLKTSHQDDVLIVVRPGFDPVAPKETQIAKFWITNGKLYFVWIDRSPEDSLVDLLRTCVLRRGVEGGGEELIALRGPAYESTNPVSRGDRHDFHEDSALNKQTLKIRIPGLKDHLFKFEKYAIRSLRFELPQPLSTSQGQRQLDRSGNQDLAVPLANGSELKVRLDDRDGSLLFTVSARSSVIAKRMNLLSNTINSVDGGNHPSSVPLGTSAPAGINPSLSRDDLERELSSLKGLWADIESIKNSKVSLSIETEVGERKLEIARIGDYAKSTTAKMEAK